MSKRWNNFWIGLAISIILPAALFMGFYVATFSDLSVSEYFGYTVMNRTLPKLIGICAFPNLLIFYLFLNKEYWRATRGVIGATMLYALAILAVKIFC